VSDLLQTNNVSLTPVGLMFTGHVDYDTWERMVVYLTGLDDAIQFAIGDAMVYGEHTHSEKYTQVMDATGMAY